MGLVVQTNLTDTGRSSCEVGRLKMRHDKVFASCVLFTIAFLLLVPRAWNNAQAGHDKAALASMGSGLASYAVLLGQFGITDLAVIAVAIIVIWNGYARKLQWTWFVMFVIVWGWAFPFLVLPSFSYARGFDVYMWVLSWKNLSSWSYEGPIYYSPLYFSIFLLMLVALILPVRSFLRRTPRLAR